MICWEVHMLDKTALHAYYQKLDQSLQVTTSHFTGGLSPAAFYLALTDWAFHIAIHPEKQFELSELFFENYSHLIKQFFAHLFGDTSGEYAPLSTPQDKRFVDQAWQVFPYTFIYESFLMMQNWWHVAATNVRGVSKHHEDVVDFSIRQILDMISPSNSPFVNPEILKTTIAMHGENFINGYKNYLEDLRRFENDLPPLGSENFIIGRNIAVTKGKVIYRNHLMELIQYKSQTDTVYAEPVLIAPAWIMKYYILDLTPKHSLVKYLVKKGHTVFMISWKNPGKEDRNIGMEDYLNLGILSALDVVAKIIPKTKTHLVGYCLGGTLAAIAAAFLGKGHEKRLKSVTLFAAQVDFNEPGELGLFIDESQITFLENVMADKGYLDTHQMSGTFQLLRSNDLIWSRLIREYLLGERKPLTDLMAWNADATRLPYRMHSEYLRQLFLHNDLAEGRYKVNGKTIALTDIDVPLFVVATERDHVSPWHSVFKINLLTTSDVTFALTSGGHNVGIVSLPVKKTKRHYRLSTLNEADHYIDANTWFLHTKQKYGSWWLAWEEWLAKNSSQKTPPPKLGNIQAGFKPIEDAPGSYVLQK